MHASRGSKPGGQIEPRAIALRGADGGGPRSVNCAAPFAWVQRVGGGDAGARKERVGMKAVTQGNLSQPSNTPLRSHEPSVG